MSVTFSHNSSLALLRAYPPQEGILTPAGELAIADVATSALELSRVDAGALCLSRPLHVLVEPHHPPLRMRDVISHSCSYLLEEGLVWQLGEDLYVCGPELTFIQMAQSTSLVGSVVLGCELCGTYSHFARRVSGFYDRPALTTPEKIAQTINAIGGARGVGRARRALNWVNAGSRSPMETVVSCMLYMPASEGGWGFMAPALNRRVRLDEAAQSITGTKTCKIDASWPEKMVALEYDSEAFHSDPARDQRRREALTRMGWSVFTLNLDDITDYQGLERKVSLFADVIPSQDSSGPAPVVARRELLQRLLAATRFGMGLDAALFGSPYTSGSVKVHL